MRFQVLEYCLYSRYLIENQVAQITPIRSIGWVEERNPALSAPYSLKAGFLKLNPAYNATSYWHGIDELHSLCALPSDGESCTTCWEADASARGDGALRTLGDFCHETYHLACLLPLLLCLGYPPIERLWAGHRCAKADENPAPVGTFHSGNRLKPSLGSVFGFLALLTGSATPARHLRLVTCAH